MLKLLIAAVTALLAVPVLLAALATGSSTTTPAHVDGIPDRLLQAYITAAAELAATGDCPGMRWQILAGIGQIESDLLAGHDIAPDGDVTPPVIGPRLDGSGVGGNTTPHYDTDNGRWDQDTEYDRAVGPNQHLPSGWSTFGADGNGDGTKDPHNADDSALAFGRELCFSAGAGGTDFTDRTQLSEALYRYNHSRAYLDDVLAAIDRFDQRAPDLGEAPESEQGQTAVAWAMDQVGKPYVWGGTGPDGFDCSGLTDARLAGRRHRHPPGDHRPVPHRYLGPPRQPSARRPAVLRHRRPGRIPGFDPHQSYGSCIVAVDDTAALFDEFAAGMRAVHGKLLLTGIPRVTRPRTRKNTGAASGFTVVDPGGNWIRIFRRNTGEPGTGAGAETADGPLARTLQNAVVLGESKGDHHQAAKILDSGLARHNDAPAATLVDALVYRIELALRVDDPDHAETLLARVQNTALDDMQREKLSDALARVAELERDVRVLRGRHEGP